MTTYQPGYHPYVEPPTKAECDADEQYASKSDPNTRTCVAAWVSHTREEFEACAFCQGFAPRCIWANDKCQHGAYIDDPTTTFDQLTRRFYCGTREMRSA